MPRFRKISALFLSLLVLFGSTSFTINMHMCMEQIESIAFFQNAPDCDMIAKSPGCPMENHNQESDPTNKGCCEDQTHLIEGQDELKEVGAVSLPSLQFIAILNACIFYSLSPSLLESYSFKEYSPPKIERDIPVLVQSFLI